MLEDGGGFKRHTLTHTLHAEGNMTGWLTGPQLATGATGT